jgi:hypothetical protein
MALGAKVVDLVWLRFLNDANQVTGVRQIAVMQLEVGVINMRVLVDVVNALRVKERSAPLDAVNYVSFFQQKLGKIRAILPCNSSDEGYFYRLIGFRFRHGS